MANLIRICTRCGNEAEDLSAEWGPGGLCIECSIMDLLKAYRTEMIRLWRKYSHYVERGINVANLDHQIQNKFRRGYWAVRKGLPDADPGRVEKLAIHYLITEAQSNAAGYSRIVRSS